VITADVYKGDNLAATLVRHGDHVEFAYNSAYVGAPVATTLPISDAPYVAPAGQLPPFFVGLLPEGRRLTALRRALKVSADDELSLLLAIGADTVGDVRILPAGQALHDPVPVVSSARWEDVDLASLFAQSIGSVYDRIAIPGVQDKISGRMISFPATEPVGPVIIKLDPPEYRHLVHNEAAMLNAAADTGLFTVPTHAVVTDARGNSGLVISRFDRDTETGVTQRFPVEDGCQASGRYPADKYNLDTIEVIVNLADRCTAPSVARLQLLQRFLLSYLAGDGDFHARNMAITRPPSGIWEPTPVYDVVCTALYGDMTLATPFNGRGAVQTMGRARLLDAASNLGIPQAAVTTMLDTAVPRIAAAVGNHLAGPTMSEFATLEKARRFTERRAQLLVA
jgi:serine/threonine-protein kinase HipA